jgi:tetratricopeptide (TPR) repeat protein
MRLLAFTLCAVFAGCVTLAAQSASPATETRGSVETAIDHLRNLEYATAEIELTSWTEAHPRDLRALNYLAINILYREMFRWGVLEASVFGQGGDVFKPNKAPVTAEFEQRLFATLAKAQAVAENQLRENPKDTNSMYWAGVSHGTRATYHFALRKEYIAALREARAAYHYHTDVQKLDPSYVDAYLVIGMNNYVVGSLPWYMKVMASLTGRHGDRAEGLRQIKQVTQDGNYAREDAKLMMAVLYQREKMYAEALPVFTDMAHSYPRNYLLQSEVAILQGMLNDWKSSAQSYDAILSRHHDGESGFTDIPVSKILYESGKAHEHANQTDAALARFIEAATQPGRNRYIYLAELAAAGLEKSMQQLESARARYKRVAEATPDSEEGKAARIALAELNERQR